MEKIKAVIFDVGRVLIGVDLNRGIFKYVKNARESSDRKLMESLFADDLFREYAKGNATPQEFYGRMKKQLNLPLNFRQFVQEWCDVFIPVEGMESLFREVAGQKKVGLLSDVGPLHWEHIRLHYPYIAEIPQPVLSFEIGALKPDPKCFKIAAESVDVPAQNCLFIDDRPINVDGARSYGMQALHFTSAPRLRQDLKSYNIL